VAHRDPSEPSQLNTQPGQPQATRYPAGQPHLARLHVVTGKGGTGKTTVAAALAIALATGGRKTLLAEVEGRQAIAQLFGREPLPYQELPIATAPGGGQVHALAVDAEAALLEYLELFYRLGVAGRALRKVGAIDFASTIAPGVRDVLLTGKVKEAVTRTADGRRVYDAVVLDAPPTGRVGKFLNVTAETARLAKIGPIKTQSEGVAAVLRSPITAVHIVTLLEEMPVQETADTLRELAGLGIPPGLVVINNTSPQVLTGPTITQEQLRRSLNSANLPSGRAVVTGLLAEAKSQQTRLDIESQLRTELRALGRPLIELPAAPDGISPMALEILAGRISAGLRG
jgi:anion-transporting  ArsA/GET3 family ATPase